MKCKLLFLVTEDWYFVSHRLDFARILIERGFEVAVACRINKHESVIRSAGIEVFSVPFHRENLSPFAVLETCLALRRLIRAFKPDIVHLVAFRPILLGWLATLGAKRPPFINALTGLGSLFSGACKTLRLQFAKAVVTVLARKAFIQSTAYNVFQNSDDLNDFVKKGISHPERSFLICGVGVDISEWQPLAEPFSEIPVVLYVGRLLKDKGLNELISASRSLRNRNCDHILRIIGDVDECNPASLRKEEIERMHREGLVEWKGWKKDILQQISLAHILVLPSYREGLPKVLLEAGLAKRAVVTCDVPGCREVVIDGINGLLVPPGDSNALTTAIERLLKNPFLRQQMASCNYTRVTEHFSSCVVNEKFFALFKHILRNPGLCSSASNVC